MGQAPATYERNGYHSPCGMTAMNAPRFRLPNGPRFRHFCADWDGALIDEEDPEFQVCTCYTQRHCQHCGALHWYVPRSLRTATAHCPYCHNLIVTPLQAVITATQDAIRAAFTRLSGKVKGRFRNAKRTKRADEARGLGRTEGQGGGDGASAAIKPWTPHSANRPGRGD